MIAIVELTPQICALFMLCFFALSLFSGWLVSVTEYAPVAMEVGQ
ncbi:hypothetical protein [Rhodopila sp.]